MTNLSVEGNNRTPTGLIEYGYKLTTCDSGSDLGSVLIAMLEDKPHPQDLIVVRQKDQTKLYVLKKGDAPYLDLGLKADSVILTEELPDKVDELISEETVPEILRFRAIGEDPEHYIVCLRMKSMLIDYL